MQWLKLVLIILRGNRDDTPVDRLKLLTLFLSKKATANWLGIIKPSKAQIDSVLPAAK